MISKMISQKIFFIMILTMFLLVLAATSQGDTGLIGTWSFAKSNVKNKVVTDLAGNRNAQLSGKIKNISEPIEALTFDGATTTVMVPKVSSADLPQREISAAAWISLRSGTQWGGIIGYVQDNGSFEKGWILGYNNTHFTFAVSTAGKLTYLAGITPFEIGQWYYVVGTYDGTTLKIFVNGKLESSSTDQSGNIDYPPKAFLEIGAYHDNDEYYRFEGDLHEVRLYNRALKAEEITAQYLDKKSLFPTLFQPSLGPYAQFTSPDSVSIFWETKQPVPSILEYGLYKSLPNRRVDSVPKRKHEMQIKGLELNQLYFYRLSDGSHQVGKIHELETQFNHTVPSVPRESVLFPEDELTIVYASAAKQILSQTGVTKGYCMMLGCGRGQFAYELAKRSDLIITCVVDDQKERSNAIKILRKTGIYGSRVMVHYVPSLERLPYTSFFANLIVSEHMISEGRCQGSAQEVFRLLRPAGGIAYFGQPAGMPKKLSRKTLKEWLDRAKLKYEWSQTGQGLWAKVVQPPLPGIGRWSHQYASPDNSANGSETLQGAVATTDLQVQWFGRPGADFGIDRNPRMPAPLSVNGRLFHQGMNRLMALDAYNGAILWSLEIPDLRRVNIPHDASNWCADEDSVYVAARDQCWRLDAYTGQTLLSYTVSEQPNNQTFDWGYVARTGNKLYGSSVRKNAIYTAFWGKGAWYDAKSGPGTEKVCSDTLFACNKDTGIRLWTYADGIILNTTITISSDRIHFVECRNSQVKHLKNGRIGSPELWQDQFLVALNPETGKKIWEKPIDTADGIVVFFGIYAENTFVIASSTSGKYYLYAYDAANGNLKWQAEHTWTSDNHSGHNQHPAYAAGNVYLEPCGYNIHTGYRVTEKMGGREGCATRASTSGALIYRGAGRQIAMWDINTGKVTAWSKLRPSCWLSVIASDGMVLAPEGGGGCSCGNWLETSIGFIPKATVTLRQ